MKKQATAVWQWFHFLVGQVPPGQKMLLLNLDETSVRFWYEPRLGLRERFKKKTGQRGPARQASRGQLRKAITHVAIICDDTAVQAQLPQVILVNERTCTVRTLRSWSPLPGCKAEVWRNKSAWINNKVFADIVNHIGKVLKAHAPDRQAILLMDAHSCHYSEEALTAARSQGIWPCIIPASTTGVLQPLDTHVFARFKMFLRTRLHQLMLNGGNRDLAIEEVLDALMHAMKGVLQKNKWAPVFESSGFGPRFKIRPTLLETLEWSSPPVIAADLPSLAQFQSCFPAGRHIPFMRLLSGLVPRAKQLPRRDRAAARSAVDDDDEGQPWRKRLRPREGGRAIIAKAKARPAVLSPSPAPAVAPMIPPDSPMVSVGGHVLHTLKPLPGSIRRSKSRLGESI